jgi:hypothetical protein
MGSIKFPVGIGATKMGTENEDRDRQTRERTYGREKWRADKKLEDTRETDSRK